MLRGEIQSLISNRDRKNFNLEEVLGNVAAQQVNKRPEIEDTVLTLERMRSQFNDIASLTIKSGNEASEDVARKAVEAIITNNTKQLERSLSDFKNWDSWWDSNMNTLSHYAAYSGHLKVIEMLIENKLSMVDTNKYGLQPLHIAAFFGHKQIVEKLLAEGASDLTTVEIQVNKFTFACIPLYLAILNNKQDTALYLLVKCRMSTFLVSGLGNIYHLLALQANDATLTSLLPLHKLRHDIHLKTNGFTPYELAQHLKNSDAEMRFGEMLAMPNKKMKQVDNESIKHSSSGKADFNLYDVAQFGKIHTMEKHADNAIKIETDKGLEAIYEGNIVELKRNVVYLDNKPIEVSDVRLLQFTFQSNTNIIKKMPLNSSKPVLISSYSPTNHKKMFWQSSNLDDSPQQERKTLTY